MAQDQGVKRRDDLAGVFIIFFAIILLFWLLWYMYHDSIVYFSMKYCYYIIYPFAKICTFFGINGAFPVRWAHGMVRTAAHPKGFGLISLLLSLNKVSYIIMPFFLIIPIKMFNASYNHIILSLRTNHGFWSMVRAQSKSFSYTIPVLRYESYWKNNPNHKKKYRFNTLMPDDFADLHKLVMVDNGRRTINVDKARAIFKDQLKQCGVPWKNGEGELQAGVFHKTDSSKLKPHEAALFVICAVRMNGRGKKSREAGLAMLSAINRSCSPTDNPVDAFDFQQIITGVVGGMTIQNAFKVSGVPAIIDAHHYVSTVLMRMLFEARKDGKLPCSHFIWLKIVDRHLWFALQGVTPRQIARGFCEASGDFAQFWNEMIASRNNAVLKEPFMDNAVVALEHRLLQGYVTQEPSRLYVHNAMNL